ncbi:hypothetical protein [Muricoccus pecuniae]|uniref:Uncharacterized protein n=1 Tax=Muricoccus pecuniae TaxID=693023 RepID=A0A840YCM7_9PROT|nr:hypothetical protein [Roseomonas pecuniae]MBB5696439.1 hypothetical protein [Roseomonas pecuniae]
METSIFSIVTSLVARLLLLHAEADKCRTRLRAAPPPDDQVDLLRLREIGEEARSLARAAAELVGVYAAEPETLGAVYTAAILGRSVLEIRANAEAGRTQSALAQATGQ